LVWSPEPRMSLTAPVVSSLVPSNLAGSGAISVTIGGLNFAVADLSPTGALGSGVCSTASWVTSSLAKCLLASGTAGATYGTVTVNSVAGTGAGVFSFDGARL